MLDPFIESKDSSLLDPLLREKLHYLINACFRKGIVLRTATTLRGPAAQAKLWCRSRSVAEVAGNREEMSRRAPRLAALLLNDWAGLGPQENFELPGCSFHQWGTAVDVYPELDGAAHWGGSLNRRVLAMAKEVGLRSSAWGIDDARSRPYHLQLSKYPNPLIDRDVCGSLSEIDEKMSKMYGLC